MNVNDPLVLAIEDIIDNGGDIPQKASNRLILAAVLKGMKDSANGREELKSLIDRNLDVVSDEFEKTNGRVAEIEEGVITLCQAEIINEKSRATQTKLESDVQSISKKVIALIVTVTLLGALLGWHIGIPLPILP